MSSIAEEGVEAGGVAMHFFGGRKGNLVDFFLF
jgi:hypothetical protein